MRCQVLVRHLLVPSLALSGCSRMITRARAPALCAAPDAAASLSNFAIEGSSASGAAGTGSSASKKQGSSKKRPASRPAKATATPKKQRASPKQASSPKSGASFGGLDPPKGWRSTYDLIVELRADRTAVVDSMGTEAISDSAEDEADRPYQTLISLMLSSQTKDTVNLATMIKLRAHGLSVQNILATPDDVLHDMIRQVGFHNNKLRYIKEATTILKEKHGGQVPGTMEDIIALPGVGPKMALILLNVCFGKVDGISVDTHVHRICNQLGWTGPNGTKQPEQTRAAIESWMPRDIWPEVNLVLVGLGQEVQTEKKKLLSKCLTCSDPRAALRLMSTLGLQVARQLALAGLEMPPFVAEDGL